MSIADKLTLLASSKEALRVKLGLPKSLPFSEYYKHSYPFDPLELFAGGKQGVWLDPSDLKTLFQDSSGRTPVTKDGDPVGLILDKSQGLSRGSELTTNGSFTTDSGWDKLNHVTWTEDNIYRIEDIEGRDSYITQQLVGTIKNNTYEIKLKIGDITAYGVSSRIRFGSTAGGTQFGYQFIYGTENTEAIFYITVPDDDFWITIYVSGTDSYVELKSISVKEVKGNHAIQPLAASRPTYRTDGVLHWLEFDGVDDYLNVSNGALINDTISVAFEYYDDSDSIAIADGGTYYWGYGTSYLNLKELGLYALGLPRTKPMKLLLGMYSNSDDLQRMFVNGGVREPERSWDASASNPLTIGARPSGLRPLTGAMYSVILSDKQISETDIEALERHTANKAGVTL